MPTGNVLLAVFLLKSFFQLLHLGFLSYALPTITSIPDAFIPDQTNSTSLLPQIRLVSYFTLSQTTVSSAVKLKTFSSVVSEI